MTDQSADQTPPVVPVPQNPPTTAWAIAALIFGIIGGVLISIICAVVALGKTRTGRFGGAMSRVVDRCGSEFVQYAAEDADGFDIEDLRPTEQTWAHGDRTVVCVAVSPEAVTGSARG